MSDGDHEPIESENEVVIEQADEETPLVIDPERRRVKTDKQDVPVETLHKWVQRGKLNLQNRISAPICLDTVQSEPVD
jgi:hypothetical protein